MYRTGDIVCVSYGDFNGDTRVGLFLIIYNEKQDRHYSSNHSNILCAKLTTNIFQGDGYVVRLYKGDTQWTSSITPYAKYICPSAIALSF